MTQASDIQNAVATNAQGPSRVSTELGTTEMQPIPDQIEAAKFVMANAGLRHKSRGLRFTKLSAPGAVL